MNLDDAIYRAAHAYPGGVEALAVRMGLKPASLRHKVSPTYPTAHLAPAELVALCAFAGLGPLQALCAGLDHVALPLPGEAGSDAVMPELADAMREAGELFATTAGAWADRRIDAAEMGAIRREALDAIVALSRVVSAAESSFGDARRPPADRAREGV